MAIRLYPRTRNPRILEKLAEVPRFTHWLLPLLRLVRKIAGFIDRKTRYRYDLEFKVYRAYRDTPVGHLEHFLLFGWGRFRRPPRLALPYDLVSGEIVQTSYVIEVLTYNGVFLPPDVPAYKLQGVIWC